MDTMSSTVSSSSRYRLGVSSRFGACFLPLPLSRPMSPSLPRLACFAPVIAPSPDVITPFHPSATSSSSRRRHLVITSAGHALPASRPALLVEGRGGATLRLLDVRLSSPARLPNAVSPSRAIWLGRSHLVPVVISRGLASPHVPTTGAFDAVRSLCVLPRWNVSIIFKMLPCQSFKTLRLFGMARLCEYRGRCRPASTVSG